MVECGRVPDKNDVKEVNMVETMRMDVPGEFSPIEESILEHLISHTRKETTENLASVLKCDLQDAQEGIESLIVSRLMKYKRVSLNSGVTYVNLQLTKEGERQAIIQRRRVKEIVVNITAPWMPKEEHQNE